MLPRVPRMLRNVLQRHMLLLLLRRSLLQVPQLQRERREEVLHLLRGPLNLPNAEDLLPVPKAVLLPRQSLLFSVHEGCALHSESLLHQLLCGLEVRLWLHEVHRQPDRRPEV